jgi:hypothetical protein
MNEPDTRTVIAADEMVHDLMAIALDELKQAPALWHLMSETAQDEVIQRVDKRVRDAVRDCVDHVAAAGCTRAVATIESVTVKSGMKIVLQLSKHDESRHELIDAQGETCLVVLADASAFADQAHDHEPNADQPALPLAA